MFLNIFIGLFFTVVYTVVECDSKCSEYILVIKEKKLLNHYFMLPTILSDITWDSLDCSDDSANTFSYDELYANKSCMLELIYNTSETQCPNKIEPIINLSTHEFISNTMTPHKTKDPEENIDTLPSVCKSGYDKYACNEDNSKGPVDKSTNGVNMIYVNENATKSSLEHINYKWDDLNFVMQCSYRDNICINEKNLAKAGLLDSVDNTINMNNHSITENVIIVLIKDNDYTKTEIKYERYARNITDFNCSDPFNGTQVISDQYMSLTYDIIRKYNCESNSTNHVNNTTRGSTTRNVNVYFDIHFNHNNTNLENIKCMDNFESVSIDTLSLNCNVAKPNVKDNLDPTSGSDPAYINTFETDTSTIWHCEFENPNFNDDLFATDMYKHQNYKIIDFRSCTKDNKHRNESVPLENKDIIIIFKTKDVSNQSYTGEENYTKHEEAKPLIDKEHLNLHLTFSNESSCNKTIESNITNGKIINTWTADEEQTIRRLYNTTLVELKVLNCISNISETTLHDKDTEKILDLNIIFNKPNNTDLTESIINDLYKIKSNSTKIAILDCVHTNFEVANNFSIPTYNNKVILECTYTDLDAIKKPIESNTTENTEKKFEKIQMPKNTHVSNGIVTTESNTQTYQSNIQGNRPTSGEDTSWDPIVYIFIALVSTVVISTIIIFALRKWKAPVSYHVTSTRDWPMTEDEVQDAL